MVDSFFALETEVFNNRRNTENVTAFLIENPDATTVITELCDGLMKYQTLSLKSVQGLLNCNESEAKTFIRHLERCDMVEKLDIADAYFVIKDAVEGLVILLKMQQEICNLTNKLN